MWWTTYFISVDITDIRDMDEGTILNMKFRSEIEGS